MKTDNKQLIDAARKAFPHILTLQALCDALEKSDGLISETLGVKISLADENKRLVNRVEELETICAESYQVVGALAVHSGVFETSEAVSQTMDNLSQAKIVHKDILPFFLPEPNSANQNMLEQLIAEFSKATASNSTVPPMSPEMFRQQAVLSAMNGMLANPHQGGTHSDIVGCAIACAYKLVKGMS